MVLEALSELVRDHPFVSLGVVGGVVGGLYGVRNWLGGSKKFEVGDYSFEGKLIARIYQEGEMAECSGMECRGGRVNCLEIYETGGGKYVADLNPVALNLRDTRKVCVLNGEEELFAFVCSLPEFYLIEDTSKKLYARGLKSFSKLMPHETHLTHID
jgi:hypothetical protein